VCSPWLSTPYAGDPDAELATRSDDVVLRLPAEQGVLDLDVTDRMDGVGSTDRLRADLGQADPTDVAGVDHFGYRPDRLFDRDVRVEPCGTVDVHIVGTEARAGLELGRVSAG